MGVRSSQPKSPNLNKADGHLLEYFRNTFGTGGGGTKDAKPGEKDNVVDADFEDVKEDKEKSA